MHRHWRDCQAWKDESLPLSTTNNEAAKQFDATLTQYVGWYDDESVGGIEGSISKMLASDPEFVMGHVLSNGLELMGTGRSPILDAEFKSDLEKLSGMATSAKLNPREKLHVNAVLEWSEGKQKSACNKWEEISFRHPGDMLAIKFAHDAYFYLGKQSQMCSSAAQAIQNWSSHSSRPLYGYLKGMHAFGLVETKAYYEAEKEAKEGLSINPKDAWATHALAHVYEMTGRHKEGIKFLSTTLKDWETCGMLACHNYWHWALYHIEKSEHKGALGIYDSQIIKRARSSKAMLDLVDAASLLTRLEMDDISVGDRWSELVELCKPHKDDHQIVFNDAHLMMAYLGGNDEDIKKEFSESVQTFLAEGQGDQHKVMQQVGEGLLKAQEAFFGQDYAQCVEILNPLRYKVIQIGGSNAQRDLFNLMLIHACLKSPNEKHNSMARFLLYEREADRKNSPMTERLIARSLNKVIEEPSNGNSDASWIKHHRASVNDGNSF